MTFRNLIDEVFEVQLPDTKTINQNTEFLKNLNLNPEAKQKMDAILKQQELLLAKRKEEEEKTKQQTAEANKPEQPTGKPETTAQTNTTSTTAQTNTTSTTAQTSL